MPRGVKKTIYGILYACVFVLIFFWIFGGFFRSDPTCFDGKKNQGEIGIDCGGPCTKCEITELQSLKQEGGVRIFSHDGNKVIALAEVLNPNESYSSDRFSYTFVVYNVRDREMERISGTDSVYALERKFLFEPRISSKFKDVQRIELVLSGESWKKEYEMLKPDVVLSSGLETKTEDGKVRVYGRIKNQGSVLASEIKITAILFDTYGVDLFPAQTIISNLGGLEERQFIVSFPDNKDIMRAIDTSMTRVFLSAR